MTEASPPPPQAGPRVTREQVRDLSRLRRASDNPMIGGVSEGLSRHLDIDPLLIRIVFGVLTLFGGAGLALYLIAWLTIPADNVQHSWVSKTFRQDPQRVLTAGLVVAAVIAGLTMVSAIGFTAPNPGPVIVVSLAALVLFLFLSRRSDTSTDESPSGEPEPEARTTVLPVGATEPPGTTSTDHPADTDTDTDAEAFDGTADPAATSASPETRPRFTRAWWQRDPAMPGPPDPATAPAPPAPKPKRPRSHLFAVTMAVVAIALGTVWIVQETTYDDMPVSVYPGTALAVIAAALLVGTWFGRSRLLIVAGVIAGLATAALSVVGNGDYGDIRHAPLSAAEVRPTYDLAAGRMVVRLDWVDDVEALDGRTIDVEGGVGQLVVVVPTSVDASITSRVEGGEITGPSMVQDLGGGTQRATMTPVDDPDPDVTISVDLNYGQISIERFDCPGSVPESGQSTRAWTGVSNAAACN